MGPIGVINMALGYFGLPAVEFLMYTKIAVGHRHGLPLSAVHGDGDLPVAAQLQFPAPERRQGQRRAALARVHRAITWPLNWIGTAIGIMLVFIPCLAESVTPTFLGGPSGKLYGSVLGGSVRPDRHLGAGLGDGRGAVCGVLRRHRRHVEDGEPAAQRLHRRGALTMARMRNGGRKVTRSCWRCCWRCSTSFSSCPSSTSSTPRSRWRTRPGLSAGLDAQGVPSGSRS